MHSDAASGVFLTCAWTETENQLIPLQTWSVLNTEPHSVPILVHTKLKGSEWLVHPCFTFITINWRIKQLQRRDGLVHIIHSEWSRTRVESYICGNWWFQWDRSRSNNTAAVSSGIVSQRWGYSKFKSRSVCTWVCIWGSVLRTLQISRIAIGYVASG